MQLQDSLKLTIWWEGVGHEFCGGISVFLA